MYFLKIPFTIVYALLSLTGALMFSSCCTPAPPFPNEESTDRLQIIDTHIHLYDTNRSQGVDWPPVTDKVLYRPVLTEHFDELADREGIASTVIVEASSRVEDNQWMLDLIKDNSDRYLALVGNLPIGTDEFAGLIDRFSKDSRFVGLRMRDRPSGDAFFTDAVWRDLAILEEKGLTLDVLIHNFTIDEVTEVARRIPDLKIMINHLGGLNITNDPFDEKWKAAMEKAALHENVYCKISGIFQRAGENPTPKNRSFYSPVFKVVFDAFGEDRVVYGSNWPVTDRGGSYSEQLGIIRGYFSSPVMRLADRERGDHIAKKLFRENAIRFYGL
jgi:predicted TIM-barrel fold metal-dependent hydrolase